jgi:hypothetical protein
MGDEFGAHCPGVRDGPLRDDLGLHLDLDAPLVSLLVLAGSQALHDPLQSS